MKLNRKIYNLIAAKFTLIEAVIAVAIVGISVTILLTVCSDSLARSSKAEQAYNQQHELTQAVEYYSIVNFMEPITSDFFDLDKFDISVFLRNAEVNNSNIVTDWQLKTLRINIENKKNNRKKSIEIDLIVPIENN